MSALIWLAVSGKDNQPVRLYVDGSAKEAADEILTRTQAPTLVRLQRDGEPIWVNPANVLYVEDAGEPGAPGAAHSE